MKAHRNKVAEGKEAYSGNELKPELLDKLIQTFGKNYKEANA